MPLTVVNLSAAANQAGRPFAVLAVAAIGDLAVSVFICQGQVDWHRHLDEDELFLVHEGVIQLESERGNLTLHAEELAVVPKGVAHRSGSALRSVVLLIRPALLTTRRNGHRRVQALDTDPPLEKVRLARALALGAPFQALALARVDDFDLLLTQVEGAGEQETAPRHGALWHVVRGAAEIEVDGRIEARLETGELAVVPAGARYRLLAPQPAHLLTLGRDLAGPGGPARSPGH